METSTVRQLLVGSTEIDRMKKEIDAVVKMVIGLLRDWDVSRWKVDKVPSASGRLGQVFHSPECEWVIEKNEHGKFDVECRIIDQVCHPGDKTSYAYDSRRNFISLEHVKKVH